MDIFYLNASPMYRAILRMTIKGIGKIRKANRKVRFLTWCIREDNLFFYLYGLKFYKYDPEIFKESLSNPGDVFRYIVNNQQLPEYINVGPFVTRDEFTFLFTKYDDKTTLLITGCEYYLKSLRNEDAKSLLSKCKNFLCSDEHKYVMHRLSERAINKGI